MAQSDDHRRKKRSRREDDGEPAAARMRKKFKKSDSKASKSKAEQATALDIASPDPDAVRDPRQAASSATEEPSTDVQAQPQKAKTKSKKKKSKSNVAADGDDAAADAPPPEPPLNETETAPDPQPQTVAKPAHRFIVFIGNLPYTTTTSTLEAHFAAIHPTSVRHITQKDDPSRSKGFAFLEFDGYDRMRTCLKLYHHSKFEGRRINVELTAGGGGTKSDGRKGKLKDKNRKLAEERKRRGEEVLKEQKEEKERKGKEKAAVPDVKPQAAESGGSADAVHPSRRRMIKGKS